MFDGPVNIPSLHERGYDGVVWKEDPWMSITPMEMLTLRPGTKLAKGHTVVAGLGLGWQLAQVLAKRSVKKVTLVERSQELIDWVLPRVPGIDACRDRLEIICGDARDVLANFAADVALIDIFPGYGSNEFFVTYDNDERFRGGRSRPKNIPNVWCWGASPIRESRGRGW
jgi:predicted RNA methylase